MRPAVFFFSRGALLLLPVDLLPAVCSRGALLLLPVDLLPVDFLTIFTDLSSLPPPRPVLGFGPFVEAFVEAFLELLPFSSSSDSDSDSSPLLLPVDLSRADFLSRGRGVRLLKFCERPCPSE